ncbi:hypothetical protein ACWT_4336 [Actinoplanes sp. SE50]|nr:hypothetical protein ACPL_4465 [Actinoplanes sp. SE50/110]ATO83751.1 hypothetical protein ACWT_4336 [Actinoplanes sp. SE50]SLM01159.1 hypothetical protein ACSP50_4392 [Actinoplanes sp. SE50/110]
MERLLCHRRLPLIAGVNGSRPAVHVWEHGSGGLRQLGVVDAGGEPYPAEAWKRQALVPEPAWHPSAARLVVTGPAGPHLWTPEGTAPLPASRPGHAYRFVAFSPDGRTLWASPSALFDPESAGERSDAIDLATGELRPGPRWDTAVVEHPGGGLLATMVSDQGATHILFARPGADPPAGLTLLRDAIILDVDGYETPVFSDDGRFLAVRGNAYVQSLDVFTFPAMRRVLSTTLGEPYPGYPYPPEWLAEQQRWSAHNIAFAPGTGTLLVGTARGGILGIDLDTEQVAEEEHSSAPISALAITSTGRLVVADRAGQVTVTQHRGRRTGDSRPARAVAARFRAATVELPEGADLAEHLIRHDGERVWVPGDLGDVTAAAETDPTWLRLQAAINTAQRR